MNHPHSNAEIVGEMSTVHVQRFGVGSCRLTLLEVRDEDASFVRTRARALPASPSQDQIYGNNNDWFYTSRVDS